MIDAYYFPFTHISDVVLNAFERCFQTVVLLRPSDQAMGDPVQSLAAAGRVELRFPVRENADQLQAILKNYQNWADLHRDEQGLRAAYYQSMNGQPPLYDESATSRIRESIQTHLRAEPDPVAGTDSRTEKLLQAGVFLSIAQQFDSQNTELNAELRSFDAMERKLFEQLKGETPSATEDRPRSPVTPGDQRLDHMIPERLVSWSLLFAEDVRQRGGDRIPIMITDSRMAVEQLISLAPEVEQIMVDLPLPDTVSQDRKTLEWRSEWQANLRELAINPWPAEAGNLPQLANNHAAAGRWCVNGYLVPGQTPRSFFDRLHSGQKGPDQPIQADDSVLNTVIFLVQETL